MGLPNTRPPPDLHRRSCALPAFSRQAKVGSCHYTQQHEGVTTLQQLLIVSSTVQKRRHMDAFPMKSRRRFAPHEKRHPVQPLNTLTSTPAHSPRTLMYSAISPLCILILPTPSRYCTAIASCSTTTKPNQQQHGVRPAGQHIEAQHSRDSYCTHAISHFLNELIEQMNRQARPFLAPAPVPHSHGTPLSWTC